ncbi:MarR family winged helix-turn-helix transcriptional regulator [Prauserella rugosa]|uniref:DNA-binding MarR family transcriptional regulator n=1 Tax=Prauserella rugosa TaxID=43354 RepID=A0A660CJT6_9PSEU|nr:MarR family transcriptional regulator [Prauserella rugosa]KID32188.1 transcriptional regulator [Prauserella sp. Am3]KMS91999.1 hypothetical protein ACZ91_06545 [Streptomyces regensis]TWH21869.1 DNA-binding MarR family transcriptional regulator [Prauserella rugosa]HEV6953125.1 MarR family transcriptional regulator [Promicromonospora sp.]
MSDLVDTIIGQWRDVRPDLDTEPISVVGRVLRLASLVRKATEEVLAESGLNRPEFDLLCAVRRGGDTMTPSRISREELSSGAAVTKRLERLTDLGLVVRERSNRDRRVTHIRLTEHGRSTVDTLLPKQIDAERAVLADLTDRQRAHLANLLSTALATAEHRAS